MVSYCDLSLSVVRALKNISWNYQSKFNETLQEASLDDPLQKYKGSQLINNNNNKIASFLFCFKNHLL